MESTLKNKVIITVAPTGTLSPKSQNPNVPVTPEEIADDVYRCWMAGASIAHLHMRDENDKGTMDPELFHKTVSLIQERCDIIINLTSSGDPYASDDERLPHIARIKPEMATFDAGSFNWVPLNVFMNSPEFLEKLAITMNEAKVKPEFEIFHPGMFDVVAYYAEQGLIRPPYHFQFVLGVRGAMAATMENLLYLHDHMPEGATWSAFGTSKNNVEIMLATLALGGHIRVGLEDANYYSRGVKASNLQLVERAAKSIKLANKEVATPAEAREILGIEAKYACSLN